VTLGMRRPAHADETRNAARRAALAVTLHTKNTPTGSLTARKHMRVLPIILWAALGFVACGARAACIEAAGCADAAPIVVAAAEAAGSAPIQVAEVPVSGVPALAASDGASPARVAAVSGARPGGTLVMRSEGTRTTARTSGAERSSRPEPNSGAERSSVWMMLLAGLAFAGFVIAKRTRG
jgi:hypothetical protein